ncbi:sigma-54-dependent transcriptional regulator [Inmirania thermothiophila]|uniref:Two component Fis family sigma54 specific transcriptional regulator n=1 Tax=Inmirania thermothiophila TaxID=1750597 RepID=A0A3N1Y0G4_9GAMM|nr:sigma-54 dependent transcriptional regulator [Inmirania thermothiophila]ROR32324.1 two component Fis family sigma54 specific transcriptional regulator [Inmirania thermothiophila]
MASMMEPAAAGAPALLVVDDEPGICNFLRRALERHSVRVETAVDAEEGEALRARSHFDVILADIRLPGRSGVEWAESLRAQGVRADIIFMTAYADLDTAVRALRAGAADFILKPFRIEQVLAAVERCLERRRLARENFVLRREGGRGALEELVGTSRAVRELDTLVRRIAPTPATVLLQGESGTGKELVARAIHRASGRRGGFVPVNCGSIASELLESELFGHAKGAFTGAHEAREGLFSVADRGTLFLDEIGEMPLAMQAKLLRAIEERRIRPVGADREVPVDVRIVAATNRNLAEEVHRGRFREDLYYRLNVVALTLPALRERREDIPLLAEHFSRRLAAELGLDPIPFAAADLEALQRHDWPGNVRELRNLIERCLLLGTLPAQALGAGAAQTGEGGYDAGLPLREVERRHILHVLEAAGGNKSEAARRLGISRKTLERKLAAWRRRGEGAAEA